MQVGSVEWTEKYRPKRLRDVVGNEKALDELRAWAENVFRPKSKKAALLHGPAGCGKTSAAYALAAEKGWEVIELNASDQRNAGVIRSIVGPASTSTTFTHRPRLIILDEADNLHGNEDRGGTKAITEIVKRSTQPIILTANDRFKMAAGLIRNCRVIAFQRIKSGTVFRILKRISEQEGIAIEDPALIALAKNAREDLRSAINDLQALAIAEGDVEHISEADITTGGRDVEEDIFGVLRIIFSAEGNELQPALVALRNLDKTPDESIQWIYKNFTDEYDPASFLHGLHYLSRADLFLGRVRRRENYKFWRYASSVMAGGVLAAKTLQHGRQDARTEGWEQRKQHYFKTPWMHAKLPEGEERRAGAMQEALAQRIATCSKLPRSYALFSVVPVLPLLFADEQKAAELAAILQLNVPEITFLLGNTEDDATKETAKHIHQKAADLLTERRKARASEEDLDLAAAMRAVKRIPAPEEPKEEPGAETDVKNQRTLTDFF
ncbi:MAG TPA: replication factor C large subunit [Methanomicrobia archaeon]|nr:replication factor C large subunit [Methanomicrobia archaeon]